MSYPNYYPQFYQQVPQNSPQSMQIQSSGFISVRNESEARNYPVAYGNSVTFKDENAPYVYTKTMGFSQLETPRFEKYKLVKEEPVLTQEEPSNVKVDNLHYDDEIKSLWSEIEGLKKEVMTLKEGV